MDDKVNNNVALQKTVAVSSFPVVWRVQKRLSDSPGMRNCTGLCSWHILSVAFVVLQGGSRLLALVGTPCWEEGAWASHPSLAKSCQGQDTNLLLRELLPVSCFHSLLPFSISPSQTLSLLSSHKRCSISAKGAEQPSQQDDHTALLDSPACLQETGSNPLQPAMTLKSGRLVPSKML